MANYRACTKHEERGYDTKLTANGTSVPITNVSYTIDKNTSEQQFNDSMNPTIAVTGLSFSGSFEHSGSNRKLSQAIEDKNGFPVNPCKMKIRIQESERTVIFKNCVVTSRQKDMPSDDRTSETYDFSAEKVTIKSGGSGVKNRMGGSVL